VFVYPQPNATHLAEDVYSEKSGYQGHKKGDLSAVRENSHYKKILFYIEKQFPREVRVSSLPAPRLRQAGAFVPRLLDVGCSSGEFLYAAKKRGFDCYGVELNHLTAKIAQANGLNVKEGTLEEAHYADNFFNVIFLGDIIEHIKDPHALIVECRRILRDGGTLVVSTPNLDSFWAKATFKLYKWFKFPWSVLTPPHHLFQFNEHNLKRFLKDNKFTPTTVWFRRPPALMYELGSLHLWGKWKRGKMFKNFLFMFFSFMLYTMLYFFDVFITPLKTRDFGMIAVFKK